MMEAVIIQKPVHDLLCKSIDWFLCDNGLRHERVNRIFSITLLLFSNIYCDIEAVQSIDLVSFLSMCRRIFGLSRLFEIDVYILYCLTC